MTTLEFDTNLEKEIRDFGPKIILTLSQLINAEEKTQEADLRFRDSMNIILQQLIDTTGVAEGVFSRQLLYKNSRTDSGNVRETQYLITRGLNALLRAGGPNILNRVYNHTYPDK
jgi:hypothetical protein